MLCKDGGLILHQSYESRSALARDLPLSAYRLNSVSLSIEKDASWSLTDPRHSSLFLETTE